MKNFARALQQAWRHWPALTIALLCSVGVAALWGANIAALFPIIETTLHGESLQQWNQKRMDSAQTNLAAHEAESRKSRRRSPPVKIRKSSKICPSNRCAENANQDGSCQRVFSAADAAIFRRYMPSKPFATVTLIAVMVAVATALKQVLMLTDTMLVTYVSQSIVRDIRGRIFDKALSLDRPRIRLLRASAVLPLTSRIRPICWPTASRISTAVPSPSRCASWPAWAVPGLFPGD